MEIAACVQSLSGKEFHVDSISTLLELENAIAIRWQIPPECQRLVCSHCQQVFGGDEKLSDHTLDGKSMSCTVLVSYEKLKQGLQSSRRGAALKALRAFRQMGIQADDDTIVALCSHLQYADTGEKRAVMEILAMAARRGDEAAIKAAREHLHDTEGVVRRTALEAYGRVARVDGKDVEVAIREVVHSLCDFDEAVKRAAENALTELVDTGNVLAISLLSEKLKSRVALERRTAVRTLGKIGTMGDEQICMTLTRCLLDEDVNVRRAAVEALKAIAIPGSKHVDEALAKADTTIKLPAPLLDIDVD